MKKKKARKKLELKRSSVRKLTGQELAHAAGGISGLACGADGADAPSPPVYDPLAPPPDTQKLASLYSSGC